MRWVINWHLEDIKIFSGSLETFPCHQIDMYLIHPFIIIGYLHLE